MKSVWPNEIQGKRLTLKRLLPTGENARLLSELMCRNALHLRAQLPFLVRDAMDETDAFEYLSRQCAGWNQGDRNDYYLFTQGILIGGLSILGKTDSDRELIYWLDEHVQGYGFMSEALDLAERQQASVAPHTSLYAFADTTATRSRALLEKRSYRVIDGQYFEKVPDAGAVVLGHHKTGPVPDKGREYVR